MDNEEQPVRSNNGRVWAGLFLLAVGAALLMNQFGFLMPFWLFKWPTFLIVIGIFMGLKHGFRGAGWIAMIFLGMIFLIDMISPEFNLRRYIWPLLVMGAGLFMILRPRHRRRFYSEQWKNNWRSERQQTPPAVFSAQQHTGTDTGADYIDATAVFGGIRKVILSKDFKGGEAVSIFGGTEIDLSKADINGTVTLELTQIFGGTKLIVPSHWNIRSEVVAFLGGIEDKRNAQPSGIDANKVLVLKGTSVLGGIDIKNY